MIEIRDLTLRYGSVAVLDVPALSVPDGKLTYVLGLNGTGKTTLLRCICGIIAPATGTVKVDGTLVRAGSRTPATLGMHLNHQAFDPRHTPRRHLRWISRARGLPASRIDEVLRTVELTPLAGRHIGQLSLGMRQRVGIAAALLARPQTLLLDEPLNGLDIAGIHWLRELLRQLADKGTCVVVTSHLLDEVERGADRIIVLGDKRLLADESLPDLMTSTQPGETTLEDVYLRIAGPLPTTAVTL